MSSGRRRRRPASRRESAPAATPRPRAGRPAADGFGLAVLGVFGLALVLRLVHVWQLRSAPFFDFTMGDAQSYHDWGLEIAGGDWIGQETFYQAPLYPYFLGFVYTLFGPDLLAVRLCQSVLGAASCALLAAAGRRLFSPAAGVAAGLMLAVYPPALFFDGLIQKASLGLFLLCLLLLLLSRLVTEPGRPRAWVWPGMVLGGLVLTREHALVFALVLLGWLVLSRDAGRRRFARAGALALGLALVLVPTAARNQAVGGDFLLTTSQFGPNFYIGNNPDADGTYSPLVFGRADPRFERRDATQIAEREVGAPLSPAQVSRYWTGRSLDYILSQPADWLRLTGRKAVLGLNAAEVADTEDQFSHAAWSAPLRFAGRVWHFGLLAPLGAAGLCLTWGRRRQLRPFHLMLAAYAASLVLFAVMGRYRYPLAPLLMPFAAAGAVSAWRMARTGSGWNRQAVAAAGVAAALLVFCNWPVLSMSDMRAITALNLGTELQAAGRLDEAVEQYRQVLALTPDDALAHSNLGTARAAQGRFAEAVGHYERAVALAPGDADAHSNLGNALLALNRTGEGVASLRRALAADPSSAEAHAALGIALHDGGEPDDAIVHLRRALDLGAASPDLHNRLGIALGSQGRLDEAAGEFRRALDLAPDHVDARANLGTALQMQGRLDEAVAQFREAMRFAPDHPDLPARLDAALAELTRR